MGVEVFLELRLVRDVRAALTRVFSLATKEGQLRCRLDHRDPYTPLVDLYTAGIRPVYQSRSLSFPVETDEYFLTVAHYVELDAIRAKPVSRVEH
jgi:hypothetical protein